jgi:hypothetical protein
MRRLLRTRVLSCAVVSYAVVSCAVVSCAVVSSVVVSCAVVSCAVAGCSSGSIDVQLRVPAGDHPLRGADSVTVTLRDANDEILAASRSSATDGSARLPGVPAGNSYTVEVDALFGTDVIARGKSCRFDVSAAHPPSPSIWFSRVGRFAPTAGPAIARDGAAVFAFGDGALVAGGAANGVALKSTEQYDATLGHFVDGPSLATARDGARAVDLGDGLVLLIGGADAGAPALEALTAAHTTPLPAGLSPDLIDHAAALAGDGAVIVAGGRTSNTPTADAWVITQAGASVDELPPMMHARARLTLTPASADPFAPLFAIGGADALGPIPEIERFDPVTRTFADSGMSLVTPRSDHTTTRLPSGLLLVVGGIDYSGTPTASAELVDPVNRTARRVARLRTARADHAAALLPSGRVLVAGGVDASGAPIADAEIFDPALGAEGDFVPTAPLSTARAGLAIVPLCDGTFLVVGGASGAEIYNPL